MTPELTTPRLTLRPWRIDDAENAMTVYGHPDVTRWLSPAMDKVGDIAAMRLMLQQWIAEDARMATPCGHWAIQRRGDATVIGGTRLLPLPPGNEDLEIGWHLRPDMWGSGYASEAGYALANWAFGQDIDELFAVVRPSNIRAAATVRRNGMRWVGETSKYFNMDLQIFRLRKGDIDPDAPNTPPPPTVSDEPNPCPSPML